MGFEVVWDSMSCHAAMNIIPTKKKSPSPQTLNGSDLESEPNGTATGSPFRLTRSVLHRMPEGRSTTEEDTAAIRHTEGDARYITDAGGRTIIGAAIKKGDIKKKLCFNQRKKT